MIFLVNHNKTITTMKTLKTLALVAATVLLASCSCGQKECKFNAKKYAECKTEKLDKIVDLDDAQEKAVYLRPASEVRQIHCH